MPENWRQSEIRIVINDKSQDSIGKHYKFIQYAERDLLAPTDWTVSVRYAGLRP